MGKPPLLFAHMPVMVAILILIFAHMPGMAAILILNFAHMPGGRDTNIPSLEYLETFPNLCIHA